MEAGGGGEGEIHVRRLVHLRLPGDLPALQFEVGDGSLKPGLGSLLFAPEGSSELDK